MRFGKRSLLQYFSLIILASSGIILANKASAAQENGRVEDSRKIRDITWHIPVEIEPAPISTEVLKYKMLQPPIDEKQYPRSLVRPILSEDEYTRVFGEKSGFDYNGNQVVVLYGDPGSVLGINVKDVSLQKFPGYKQVTIVADIVTVEDKTKMTEEELKRFSKVVAFVIPVPSKKDLAYKVITHGRDAGFDGYYTFRRAE